MNVQSPVELGEWALVSHLRRNRNEKTNCHSSSDYRHSIPVGRCVATIYSGQGNTCAKPNAPSNRAPSTVSGANKTSTVTDNREVNGTISEPILEEANEQPSYPDLEPIPELENADSRSENMVYVPGFGWIESQGSNQVEYAEDIYKN